MADAQGNYHAAFQRVPAHSVGAMGKRDMSFAILCTICLVLSLGFFRRWCTLREPAV